MQRMHGNIREAVALVIIPKAEVADLEEKSWEV